MTCLEIDPLIPNLPPLVSRHQFPPKSFQIQRFITVPPMNSPPCRSPLRPFSTTHHHSPPAPCYTLPFPLGRSASAVYASTVPFTSWGSRVSTPGGGYCVPPRRHLRYSWPPFPRVLDKHLSTRRSLCSSMRRTSGCFHGPVHPPSPSKWTMVALYPDGTT